MKKEEILKQIEEERQISNDRIQRAKKEIIKRLKELASDLEKDNKRLPSKGDLSMIESYMDTILSFQKNLETVELLNSTINDLE